MFRKLTVALAVFFCIQGICAETEDEVMQEMRPKLDALRMNVDEAIHNNGLKIGEAHSNMNHIVNVADAQINQDLINLNIAVEQANADGKNIVTCVSQKNAAVETLGRRELELCRNDENLNIMSQRNGQLNSLKSTITSAPQICKIESMHDVAKLRSCLENIMNNVNNQITSLAHEIINTVTSVEAHARQCVKTNGNAIISSIAHITSEFHNCVSNA